MVFARHAVTRTKDAVAGRTVLRLRGRAWHAADRLSTLGFVVIAIGATHAATGGRGRGVLIVTALPQRRRSEGRVARVVAKERAGALLMQPWVVGSDAIGRVPQVPLPRRHRDGQRGTMGDTLGALIGVGGVGRIAHGQCQAQFPVEIGGCEVDGAKDVFGLSGGFGVDVLPHLCLQVRGHFGATAHERAAGSLAHVAPREASGRHLVLGEPAPRGPVVALRRRGLVLRDRLELKQGDLGVLGTARFGGGLAPLSVGLGKGAGELEPLGPALSLRAKSLPIGLTQRERLAALAGVGAALIARIGWLKLTIGAAELALDQAKVGEEVHRDRHDLVDDLVTDAVAEVAQGILPGNLGLEAGERPVVTAFVSVVEIGTALSVIDILSHCGGHCEHDEAGGVVAAAPSGAIIGRTEGAGEAKVQGGAGEPPEAAIDVTLRREFNGRGYELVGRQPPAWGCGERRGAGVAVGLVEGLGMGDKGVESKGRALVVGKGEQVSAQNGSSFEKKVSLGTAMMPHIG